MSGLATPSQQSSLPGPVEWALSIIFPSQSLIVHHSEYGDLSGRSLIVERWHVSGMVFNLGLVASACTS